MKPASFQAYMDKITTLKDNSFKVVLHTQELSADDGALLLRLRNQLGWALFAPHELTGADIPPEAPKAFATDKTPSQRLRNVLFVYWKQCGSHGDFDGFYRQQMEQFIEWVKERLHAE